MLKKRQSRKSTYTVKPRGNGREGGRNKEVINEGKTQTKV
jgi:hypothetical protein